MKEVTIYTDGACSGNPGPGGWAAILIYKQYKKEITGGDPSTTNNRMELLAVIQALEELTEPCIANIYSDSRYVIDAVEKGWLEFWQNNNWQLKTGGDVKNQDLWIKLIEQANVHTLSLIKVLAHSDNEFNNRCDTLARAEILKTKTGSGKVTVKKAEDAPKSSTKSTTKSSTKTAAKTTAAKSTAKTTAAKTTAAKSTGTKSSGTKSTAAKSTATKSTAAKSTAAKSTTAAKKTTAAKSTAAKTTTTKKAAGTSKEAAGSALKKKASTKK